MILLIWAILIAGIIAFNYSANKGDNYLNKLP